ncbi:MAG: hypothetical protein JWN48_3031 [Myxococcaceae bacterium]|nr:hypothetical protein [Myxococcaceae bacterium]
MPHFARASEGAHRQTRVFVPQDAVELWLSEGRASLTQDTLTLDGQPFLVSGAVRFLSEVSGAPDEPNLVGRVKSREQLEALEAEHAGDSVVLRDNAYEVAEGYLLALVHETAAAESFALLQTLFASP